MSAFIAPGERQSFPRNFRLTKTDEFSSVFGFRRAIRGKHFLLHYGDAKAGAEGPRLGVVVAKRLLKTAVKRNLVKRLGRECFRRLRAELPPRDLILRLAAKPVALDTRSGRLEIAAEIAALMHKLSQGKR